MNRTRLLCGAVTLALAVAVPASATDSHGAGGGSLHDDDITVGLTVLEPGSSVPIDAHHDRSRSLITYEVQQDPPPANGDLSHLCNASTTPGTVVFGWLYRLIGRDPSGNVVVDTTICEPVTDPSSGPPPPPPLPHPPTIAAVWSAATLPVPALGVDPATRGITGLPTRLWSGGADTVDLAVSVDGWTVTGVARRVGYVVDTGDGAPAAAASPGDAHHPIATHVYETKGAYDVSAASLWTASATLSGPSLVAPITVDLGRATLTATRVYRVAEIRSVLIP